MSSYSFVSVLYNGDRNVFGGLAACGGDPSVVVFKQVFVEIDRTVQFVNINFVLDMQ